MTQRLMPLDGAHAGDLIGHTKNGRPIYLPGGGARDGEITAEPDDLDDLDDGPDGPDDLDEPDTSAPRKPSYKELEDQLAKTRAAVRRNNQELANRRLIGQWAAKHQITDLDAWLESIQVDKETATRTPAAPAAPAAKTETDTSVGVVVPAGEGFDEAEVERRVELRMEQLGAAQEEQNDILRGTLAATVLQLELRQLGFRGKIETALRVADLAAITVSEDGTVSGADVAAASLKDEIPEWFRAPTARGNGGTIRTGGEDVDGGGKTRPPAAPVSWEKRVADQLRGVTK